MPRLKASRLAKVLNTGPTSSGYDGLDSGDGPRTASAAAVAAAARRNSSDKAADDAVCSPGSTLERSGDCALLRSSKDDVRCGADSAVTKVRSSDAQSKAEKSKKTKKAIGAKLRFGKSKINSWEYSDSQSLRSPTSPSTDADAGGQTFAEPAMASSASGTVAWTNDARSPSAELNLGPSSNGNKVTSFIHPLFSVHKSGAEQRGYDCAIGGNDAGDAVKTQRGGNLPLRSNGWTSASCASTESVHSREGSVNAAALSAECELAQSQNAASQRQPEQQPTSGSTNKKERKLKLKLNLKSSIRKISADLARALKRSDGLNAQVTLMSPPATGGDTPTSSPATALVVVNATSFKGVGGSVGGDDAERRLHVSSRQLKSGGGGGYSALSASCGSGCDDDEGGLNSAADDDDEQDDVDEVSSPHDTSGVSRFAISARVPLRDGGFKPL